MDWLRGALGLSRVKPKHREAANGLLPSGMVHPRELEIPEQAIR